MSVAPEPGRPISLGRETDLADAVDLLAVIKALRSQSDRNRSGINKALRESLWWMWEQPRLPRPLVRSKYPATYPWSPAARVFVQTHRDDGGSDSMLRGLIIEHLIPANHLVQEAIASAHDLDAEGLLALLSAHGPAAVITSIEDKRLAAAGVASRMPSDWDGIDVWARPRLAGFDLSGFAPLMPASDGLNPA